MKPVHEPHPRYFGDGDSVSSESIGFDRTIVATSAVLPVGGLVAVDSNQSVIHVGITMKTATVRDLRNHFARVAAWVAEGEPVEITKAGKPFARLMPATLAKVSHPVKPDIMARLRRTWGTRTFSAQEVARMRAAELEGEQG